MKNEELKKTTWIDAAVLSLYFVLGISIFERYLPNEVTEGVGIILILTILAVLAYPALIKGKVSPIKIIGAWSLKKWCVFVITAGFIAYAVSSLVSL